MSSRDFHNTGWGQAFTNIDFNQAYFQVPVDEAAQPFFTVNSHLGLFTVTWLPFVVWSAPGIFLMTGLVGDIKGVGVYLDDILITRPNAADHIATVSKVLDRLHGAGLQIKKEKCSLMESRITYLGHKRQVWYTSHRG